MRWLCGLLSVFSLLGVWLFWVAPVAGELPAGDAVDSGWPLPKEPGARFELRGEIAVAEGEAAKGPGGLHSYDEVREYKPGGVGGRVSEITSFGRPRLALRLPGSVVVELDGRSYAIAKPPSRVALEKSWKDVDRYAWGFRPGDTAVVRGSIDGAGRPVARSVRRGPARGELFPEERAPYTSGAVVAHWIGKTALSAGLLGVAFLALRPRGTRRGGGAGEG